MTGLDNQISSEKMRKELVWQHTQIGLLAGLEAKCFAKTFGFEVDLFLGVE